MAERTKPLAKGEMGPDFTIKDQHGKDFKLSELKGRRVLLSFHPLAWTKVCAEQMKALEANKETFASLNTVAVGISVDAVPAKNAWGKNLGIKETPLVADFWPHGEVARLYGIFREKEGYSERANIILDERGIAVFVKIYEIEQLPDINEIISVLKTL
jgi:peroxiredoxin